MVEFDEVVLSLGACGGEAGEVFPRARFGFVAAR